MQNADNGNSELVATEQTSILGTVEPTKPADEKAGVAHHITEGVLLLLATATAYAACYCYELGYTGYYGIPREFIYITIQSILFCFGIIMVFVVFAFQMFWMVAEWSKLEFLWGDVRVRPYVRLVKKHSLGLVIYGSIFWLVGFNLMNLVFGFVYVILPISLDLVGTLVNRGNLSFGESLESWLEIKTPQMRGILNERKIMNFYMLSMLLLTPLAVFMLFGRAYAMGRTSFPFLEETREVVLTRYGDALVVGAFDVATGKLLPEFRLLQVGELKQKLIVRRTGKISVTEILDEDIRKIVRRPPLPEGVTPTPSPEGTAGASGSQRAAGR